MKARWKKGGRRVAADPKKNHWRRISRDPPLVTLRQNPSGRILVEGALYHCRRIPAGGSLGENPYRKIQTLPAEGGLSWFSSFLFLWSNLCLCAYTFHMWIVSSDLLVLKLHFLGLRRANCSRQLMPRQLLAHFGGQHICICIHNAHNEIGQLCPM